MNKGNTIRKITWVRGKYPYLLVPKVALDGFGKHDGTIFVWGRSRPGVIALEVTTKPYAGSIPRSMTMINGEYGRLMLPVSELKKAGFEQGVKKEAIVSYEAKQGHMSLEIR